MKPEPYFEKISYFCRNYALLIIKNSSLWLITKMKSTRGQC